MAPGATPWVAFTSFSILLGCSATLEGLLKEVRASTGQALPTTATSRAVSILELAGPDARMAGG